MTTTLRIDDKLKHDCEVVLDDLGLSMAGAVTIFLKQVVKQRGIPFAITCDRQSPMDYIVRREVSLNERGRIAKQFAAEMREGCEREWTMEDIDAEIAAARKDRKVRKSQSTAPSQN